MAHQARRGPGRPAAYHPTPGAEELLDRAAVAFAEEGYDALSITRLSTELGMGRTFLSDRFGSKEELWKESVRRTAEKVFPAVQEELADDGRDDLDRLVGAIRSLHRLAAGGTHFARLFDQESRTQSPRLDFLTELMAPVNAQLRPLFERLVEDGRVRPMPWYLFFFLAAYPTNLYSQPPLARWLGRPDDASDHELMVDLVLGGLVVPDGPET